MERVIKLLQITITTKIGDALGNQVYKLFAYNVKNLED